MSAPSEMCRTWLRVVRSAARQHGEPTDHGAAVLGDGFGGYTVEFADATQIYVGRTCCKCCARAEAIVKRAPQ